MNPNKTTLRELLDDLLPPSDECHGPDRAHVLALLRSECVRRRRQHASAALAAVALLMLGSLLWKSPSTTVPSPVAATVPSPVAATVTQPARVAESGAPDRTSPVAATLRQPAPLVIEHVNDEQLITLLQGTPSALMEWPNGDRTLLVLKH